MPNWKGYFTAKAAMPAPIRDTQGYGYNYADLAQVKSIIDPPCFENGVGYVQYQHEGVLHTEVVDAESGETLIADVRSLGGSTDQQRGSSETYQRRYALLTVFGLAPEDDDGEAASKTDAEKGQTDIVKEERNRAVIRLKEALKKHCDKFGGDVDTLIAEVKSRNDYMDSAQFYNRIAYEYESKL